MSAPNAIAEARLEIDGPRDDRGAMPVSHALAIATHADAGEVALLRRAAAGEASAARALFREHGRRVHRTATRILGDADGDVDDVVQQTFLAALEGADGFDGRSALSTWLVGIASRRALDLARSRARRARWGRLGAWLGLPVPAAADAPDAPLEQRSVAARALATLTPEQRVVFVLSSVEGYTLQEISAMTETGISTLHARLAAARKRLDAFLAAETTEDP